GLSMRSILLACAAPLVVLGGCASVATVTPPPAGPAAAADTAYGMFLAGNAALNEGRNGDAAKFLDAARAQSGEEAAVAERAFTAALLAGDITKAAALSPDGPNVSEPTKRLGRLVKAVELLAEGKGKLAR